MTKRIQLTKDCYMALDGQPQIVLSGTVFDAPDGDNYHPSTAVQLSPAEPAAALGSHGRATTVRNRRTR